MGGGGVIKARKVRRYIYPRQKDNNAFLIYVDYTPAQFLWNILPLQRNNHVFNLLVYCFSVHKQLKLPFNYYLIVLVEKLSQGAYITKR